MVKRVFMVGAFPPPVHGMAQVNAQVMSALVALEVDATSYDLSARTLDRGIVARLRRSALVARTLVTYALGVSRSPAGVLYVGLSGGWGQAYEICFVALAKVFKFSVFLHHHSFAYLHTAKDLTRLLVWVAGKEARHVVLCERMAIALRRHYGEGMLVRVVSNAALIAPSVAGNAKQREALRSLGFLSNISREKGVFLFIGIVEELHRRGAGGGRREDRGPISG